METCCSGIGEQAALGKADAVDQDRPEGEADQARCHAEPPIEFRQIDSRECKRRRQDQRNQHHSDDSAEPEQQQIAERGHRFADDRQDHQGDGGRPCQAVHEADHEGSQPVIERDPAEPTAVEPRQRRLLFGVPVRAGTVTVRVPVQVVAVRMEVIVDVELMYAGSARMRMGRAARAGHACQGENAEQDEHDADGKFHRHAEPRRNDDPEHDDCRADRDDRHGVPDAPSGADQRRARHAALATDDRCNGDHVVGVGRMPHPEEEAEKQEGHDVQGGLGHCARFKMASKPRTFGRDHPRRYGRLRQLVHQGFSDEDRGRALIDASQLWST